MREVIEQTWGWNEDWQRRDFDRRFDEYDVSIIEREDRAVAGLMLETKADSLYIHELQVLPEYQGRGVGTAVVRMVVERAAGLGRDVTLSVVRANPRAKQLYERLGFRVTGVEEPCFRMRKTATLAGQVTTAGG